MPGIVNVCSKLPNGLTLTICQMETVQEQVMGGGWRDVQRARRMETVIVHGTGRRMDDMRMLSGYAVTPVDADHWDRWLSQNADSDLVRNRVIFAQVKMAEAQTQARDNEATRSGLEPIDPNNLPREFNGKITKATADAS